MCPKVWGADKGKHHATKNTPGVWSTRREQFKHVVPVSLQTTKREPAFVESFPLHTPRTVVLAETGGIWLWVKTVLVPFWGRCTTHFRTYFSGWIGMFTGGQPGFWTHGHLPRWCWRATRCPTSSGPASPVTWYCPWRWCSPTPSRSPTLARRCSTA